MTTKNSALKVLVEKTSTRDILKRRSIKIHNAQFIEDIGNDTDPISGVITIDENKLISYTLYTEDLHALNLALYDGVALELILCQYDDAPEFERWLSNYDEGMFTIFLQRVTTQIIAEVEAMAQIGQDLHDDEDISDDALRYIILWMERYNQIINILSERYKTYYANIKADYFKMLLVKNTLVKSYSKENWPILFGWYREEI